MVLPGYPFKNNLDEDQLNANKTSFLCRWFNHRYETISIEKHGELCIYTTSVCSRCGHRESTATIGPFNLSFTGDEDGN